VNELSKTESIERSDGSQLKLEKSR